MATNKPQFIAYASIGKKVTATQFEDKGFKLSVKIEGLDEDLQDFTLTTVSGEEKIFKSLDSVQTELLKSNIFSFDAVYTAVEISANTRAVISEEEKKAIKKKELEAKLQKMKDKEKELKEELKTL